MSLAQTGERTWIDEAADRFECDWKRGGDQPRIEDFLAEEAGPRRSLLLQELLRVERELRANAGEQPSAAEYLERFPGDRKGQIAHELAMKVSDSHWHTQLSEMAKEIRLTQSVYWMWPFENYKTFCPYLVGSYQEVSEELSGYLQIGYRTFILDIPPNREELRNVQIVFQMASERALP